ncbi:hypothetical protein PMG71_03835 [Roseofilum sp. BLCC_M154]|uniref:Polymerase nucleotidyl transferase domain-containing protein n=1 Tax=Roseofilum acuticapitatum BLCC-M154 TaxID=3022444 RepID=A0ABT7ANS9_9CYAN|nr:hypothetical protein [Roseofilum acuticapitatum]MDJ1168551.1 hypothetical protein [Roseofilum acuticapitatum BLCC-M154]
MPLPGYKPQAEDTSIDADIFLFEKLRQFSPVQKTQRVKTFNQSVRKMALFSLKRTFPQASPPELTQAYVNQKLLTFNLPKSSDQLLDKLMILDPISLAQNIAEILNPLDIPYMVGGSVASSLWGEERSTQDLDLVIDLQSVKVAPLVAAMSAEFYINEATVTEAMNNESSFNAIHLFSAEKVDFFVLPNDDFSRSKFSRRQPYRVSEDPNIDLYLYSPEDIVLQKLRWYTLTGMQSQKQWRDVLGVLKVQRLSLDWVYLKQWAEFLQLTSLLNQGLQESGLEMGE